ncbi:beta-adaptin-like protein B [Tanacetum coccineum]
MSAPSGVKYKTADALEAENIIQRVTPRLQHATVVLSAVKMILQQMEVITSPDVIRTLCKKLAPPLVTLLSSEHEIQFVALSNINLIVQRRPTILAHEMKVFFCKYNDPIYVKMEKLEIMMKLASERNIDQALSIVFTQASMIWIIGEYAERIDNADELLESFLEGFSEEPAQVQLQLLTATVKLFLKKPTEGPQQMIQVVLNNATLESGNPDLRDRAYIYWRLLSTDPERSLLDELLANIATLSSVYHKPPETFVTRVRTIPTTEEVFLDAEMPTVHVVEPSPIIITPSTITAIVPDLLDLGLSGEDNSAIVPIDQPASPTGPPLPVVLPASAGQGLQISAQLFRRDGNLFYCLLFENNTETPLDGFTIQFNKNTFGLAAGGPLQVPLMHPGTTEKTLVPMVMFQNIARGPPNSLLQVAIKNNQQPVWYFTDKISMLVLFKEDGKMERSTFLETWRSLPDSKEVSKDIFNN